MALFWVVLYHGYTSIPTTRKHDPESESRPEKKTKKKKHTTWVWQIRKLGNETRHCLLPPALGTDLILFDISSLNMKWYHYLNRLFYTLCLVDHLVHINASPDVYLPIRSPYTQEDQAFPSPFERTKTPANPSGNPERKNEGTK